MIVDSHCHASSRWYEPVDTLLFNMDRCGVDRAILVQLLGSTNNADMIAACRAHPDRFAFVAAIDPAAPDAAQALARAVDSGARGLRMRAGWRQAQGDPLALWRMVEMAGLRVSMVGPVASFTDGSLAEVAAACPALHIIVEHLGGLARPDVGNRMAALPHLIALAHHANVAVKLPGLGQIAPRNADFDAGERPIDMTCVHDLLAPVIGAFGADRLLWGSDFPPVASREGYANALNWTRDFIGRHWPEAVQGCFGGTARRIFGF